MIYEAAIGQQIHIARWLGFALPRRCAFATCFARENSLVLTAGHSSSEPSRFSDHRQRDRTELSHRVPCEPYLQALCCAIVGQAPNPDVVNTIVFERERLHHVLTVHDPTPAVTTPARFGRPVIDFVRVGIELAGVHTILGLRRCDATRRGSTDLATSVRASRVSPD
jgi:hypothetical protein